MASVRADPALIAERPDHLQEFDRIDIDDECRGGPLPPFRKATGPRQDLGHGSSADRLDEELKTVFGPQLHHWGGRGAHQSQPVGRRLQVLGKFGTHGGGLGQAGVANDKARDVKGGYQNALRNPVSRL